MAGKLAAFHEFRSRMNTKLLEKGNLQLKRFFNLDTQVYTDGALSSRTKELMGLVASAVLRCDDCITYHVIRCAEEGVTDDEFFETFNVILVVGGSITIPHLRRAVETLEEIRNGVTSEKTKRGNNVKEAERTGQTTKWGKGKTLKRKTMKGQQEG
jgi:AhpD family alkylhydroperoxidase